MDAAQIFLLYMTSICTWNDLERSARRRRGHPESSDSSNPILAVMIAAALRPLLEVAGWTAWQAELKPDSTLDTVATVMLIVSAAGASTLGWYGHDALARRGGAG